MPGFRAILRRSQQATPPLREEPPSKLFADGGVVVFLPNRYMTARTALPILSALIALVSCASKHASRGLPEQPDVLEPIVLPSVQARCAPPVGWALQPREQSRTHIQELWLSPTGDTAYGIIHFSLPLPVGPNTVLWFFLREMRQHEGEARLVSKQRDPDLNGLRFVAEGGKYLVRTNLTTSGFHGWAVYAGTRRDRDIRQNELEMAELARENTETGVDANPSSVRP